MQSDSLQIKIDNKQIMTELLLILQPNRLFWVSSNEF